MFKEPSPFLDQHETSLFLRLPERTLERMRAEGTGPAFMKFGRRVLYAREDLQAYTEKQRRTSTSQTVAA